MALTAGVEGKITQTEPAAPDHCTGAIVNFTFEHKAHRYAAEVQAIDRVARLDLVKTKFNDLPGSKLLVAPYITAEMAEHCRALGLQFIDTAGNAYLKAGGMYIYITGHKRNLADMPAANDRATTATGMRVVFSLICRPELLNAPYREIAAAAGVALGTVGWVFIALQKRGHLLTDKRKRRQFVDIQRVIEEWALNYPVRLRPKLTAQRFHAPAADWWKNVRLEKYAARFGGEVAGDILTKYRNPGEVLIYLPGDPGRLIIDNRLKADPDGEVEIVEQFWHLDLKTKENRTVPPLLVYADLLATPDARNHEVAKLVYERYIKNA
ncbi:MAG: type IV toxin-antitoxin system AbiEi family antitoxin [Elusimicrobia bacterium]|nr:type IV toxin-antitoxin system AbiEi family antitoxin [Elusimicrobiota bacterium]